MNDELSHLSAKMTATQTNIKIMDSSNDKIDALRENRAAKLKALERYPPLSITSLPSNKDRLDATERLNENGIRQLPFPFKGAIAITSDIDRSNRQLFDAYIDQLVGTYGLDFGDSVWLENNRIGQNGGLAFFGPSLTYDPKVFDERREWEMNPYEIAEQYHKGNIDHWHSFLVRGPRTVRLTKFHSTENAAIFTLPPEPDDTDPDLNVMHFPVTAIIVVVRPGSDLRPRKIKLTPKGQNTKSDFDLFENPEKGNLSVEELRDETATKFILTINPAIESGLNPIQITELHAIEILFESSSQNISEDLIQIQCHNYHSDFLLDRLRHVRDRFGFMPNFSSLHARWHFPSWEALNRTRNDYRDKLQIADKKLISFPFPIAEEPNLGTPCGDDQLSFARLYPELRTEFGLFYFRITGPVMPEFWDIREDSLSEIIALTYPMRSRDGGAIFNVRSTKGRVSEEDIAANNNLNMKTTAKTFSFRLSRIMDDLEKTDFGYAPPLRGAFFYTHLGNLERLGPPPSPYFDRGPLDRLSDKSFGISARFQGERQRTWFTRASVLADFAAMTQVLPHIATRDSQSSRIDIQSFEDPLLEAVIPHSANQLYGQTFYVDDAAKTEIFLDGTRIPEVQINPAEPESKRESVTIVSCGIRRAVFDEADPKANESGSRLSENNSVWTWHCDDDDAPSAAYGKITISEAGTLSRMKSRIHSGAATHSVRLQLNGYCLGGAQHFFYSAKRMVADTFFGVAIHTENGGRFYFGDEELLKRRERFNAFRTVSSRFRAVGAWQTFSFPFFDMDWNASSPRQPLPSHPIKYIEFLLSGNPGDWVALDRVEFGRPKTAKSPFGENLAVLGGRLRSRNSGTKITIYPHCINVGGEIDPISTITDEYGGFSFPNVPLGAWKLHLRDGDLETEKIVELRSDSFDNVL